MSVDLRECLVDNIRSSHLTNVQFFNVCDIPRMVFVNTGLKHLQLKSSGWKASQDFIQAQDKANTPVQAHSTSGLAPVYPRLESFRTDHSYPIEYFGDNTPGSYSVSPFSCLSTLSSTIKTPQDFTDCMKILNRTAGTIENLHIHFFYQIEAPPKPLDFKLFPRLHLLEILHWSHATLGRFEDGIHHILRLLDCPSTSNTLSSIRFTINISMASTYPQDGLFSSSGSPATELLALDNLLSGPKYSSVQTISFLFRIEFSARPVTPSEDTFIIEAVDCVKRVFSLTSKLGLLKIAVEVVESI
ncbi:hypothetical protein GALMADRAFT_428077 [Galerina marginata CBS 339.88]|uniref:Uncharacterized protein n=1 Tax=Galerina marginata (strain CBS 339.88) TaxID=685588 RepID=A0A067T1M3_GALM3|nr:hypothetical protein GALMADRAFT_428077 [Galerina marginata CBS 339.88]